jgi:hypothetical protein
MSIRATVILAAIVLSQSVFATGANACHSSVPGYCAAQYRWYYSPAMKGAGNQHGLAPASTNVSIVKAATSLSTIPKVPALTIHPTIPTIHR